jgi:oligosaccharide reducing-end xylanase
MKNTGLGYFITLFGAFAICAVISLSVNAQYEVATWYKFKKAAITYTFDDNTANQLPVALPLFDQYGFKVTFYPVINWGPNWINLQTASNNGHEVGSHTVNHYDLDTMKVVNQLIQYQTSQNTINTNITNAKCVTIAYPSCKFGDLTSIQTYYIAGRVCGTGIEPSTPTNFYKINSLVTGANGAIKLSADFNGKVEEAKSSNGWVVFLTHAIDGDGGYSSTSSTELATHLAFVNSNSSDYWVGTFRNVVKYIKERNAVTFSESAINTDSLQLVVSDNLDNAMYDVPVTIRRAMPAGWSNANVYLGSQKINSSISVVGASSYIVFDAIPDQGNVYLAKSSAVTSVINPRESISIKVEPNPFSDVARIKTEGTFNYYIYALDGKLMEKGVKLNSDKEVGGSLKTGAYILNVINGTSSYSTKIVKK